MLARVKILWITVRDSLWFLPGLFTLVGILLAFGVTNAERAGLIAYSGGVVPAWVFGGGAEGARGVLNAIAGGLITVTGVVFSVTIVALQLASTQFTPRILRNFTADRGNQLVLAVFIGTFTYTLLVLRTVRTGGENEEPFIPRLAVTLAVALVLVSIGFLIFFINHSARSIQVAAILDRVAKRTLADIGRLFPEQVGRADESLPADPRRPERECAEVAAAESGYLQAVDAHTLFELGESRRLVVAMEPLIGDWVLAGQPLALVWPPDAVDDRVVEAIRTAFVLGPERTPEQDVEFGIIEISDIALKALSPGINDPTTAFRCMDRLGEILLALGTRRPPQAERTQEGQVHYLARHTTFERAVGLAFDQIRHFGASNPAVAKKLLQTVSHLAELVPPGCRPPLREQAEAVMRSARSTIEAPVDLEAVEEAARRLLG